ncbi:MAG: hypothetical protein ACSHX6_05080 [Akkermansiaceae bacterium]
MKVAEIFEEEPIQWGLRGDPYLWGELKERCKHTEMPDTSDELQTLIQDEYALATGYPITHLDVFNVERFSHGGMSSGAISPEFWIQKAIPLLLERQKQ